MSDYEEATPSYEIITTLASDWAHFQITDREVTKKLDTLGYWIDTRQPKEFLDEVIVYESNTNEQMKVRV